MKKWVVVTAIIIVAVLASSGPSLAGFFQGMYKGAALRPSRFAMNYLNNGIGEFNQWLAEEVDEATMYGWEITPDEMELFNLGLDLQLYLGKPINNVLDARVFMGYLCIGPAVGGYYATYGTTHERAYTLTMKPAAYYAGVETRYGRRYGGWYFGGGIGVTNFWANLDVTTEYEEKNLVDHTEREQVRFSGNGFGWHAFADAKIDITDRLRAEVRLGYRNTGPIEVRDELNNTKTLDFTGLFVGFGLSFHGPTIDDVKGIGVERYTDHLE